VHTVATEPPLYPPNFLQERWIEQYSPDKYRRLHLVSAIRCTGHLDTGLLRRSVAWVEGRHAILRAIVVRDDFGVAWIAVADQGRTGLRELCMHERNIHEVVDEFRVEPFNLESGPLFRVAVGQVDDQQSICVLVIHHLISDGWSLGVFWSEVLHHYNQHAAGRTKEASSPPALQFTEAMRRQKEWLSSAAAERARGYWRRRLEGCGKPVMLPNSRSCLPDASLPPISGCLGADDCMNLAQAARLAGVSFSSAVLAAFAVLLSSWGAGEDVITWVLHSGRRRKESMKAIGCFHDMWLLSARINSEMSLSEAMSTVHAAAVEALPALDLPAVEIGKELAAIHGDSLRPAAVFNFLPAPARGDHSRAGSGALVSEPVGVATRERYITSMSGGLKLFATVRWDQSVLDWNFFLDPEFFDDAAVEQASDFFSKVLRSMGSGAGAPIPSWENHLPTSRL
jgi:hypothetical protein